MTPSELCSSIQKLWMKLTPDEQSNIERVYAKTCTIVKLYGELYVIPTKHATDRLLDLREAIQRSIQRGQTGESSPLGLLENASGEKMQINHLLTLLDVVENEVEISLLLSQIADCLEEEGFSPSYCEAWRVIRAKKKRPDKYNGMWWWGTHEDYNPDDYQFIPDHHIVEWPLLVETTPIYRGIHEITTADFLTKKLAYLALAHAIASTISGGMATSSNWVELGDVTLD